MEVTKLHMEKIIWDAVESGAINAVKLILDAGYVDVNEGDGALLRVAIVANHFSVLKTLIEHGADIHAMDDAALKCAIGFDRKAIVKYLEGLDK